MLGLLSIQVPIQPNPSIQIEVVRQLSYRNKDQAVRLCRVQGTWALFFQSKMSCDVDGSPNAYNPDDDNLALDVIASAEGARQNEAPNSPLVTLPSPDIVVYVNGAPYIQPDGPFKGFYVSETSYQNRALAVTDPNKYLDARSVPYIVLPGGLVPEAQLGDLAAIYDPVSKNLAFAIFGDVGPSSESGEASLAAIQRLGLPAINGKSSPGEFRNDLFYLVFPKSAWRLNRSPVWPPSQESIDHAGNREFRIWGGFRKLDEVLGAYGAPPPR